MRCPSCETETTLLLACARCFRLHGLVCCCLACYQACKKLEATDDKIAAQHVELLRPPTVH